MTLLDKMIQETKGIKIVKTDEKDKSGKENTMACKSKKKKKKGC